MSEEREALARVIFDEVQRDQNDTTDWLSGHISEETRESYRREADAVLAHLRARGLLVEMTGAIDWQARAETAERKLVEIDKLMVEAEYAVKEARLEHAQLVVEWERYREALEKAQTALRHVSVTSSRYRSHQGSCQARCTCDALTDDKLVKNEINRVIQPALLAIDAALTPPSPVKE